MANRYRAVLFIPGTRPDWVAKAERVRPDGILIDLEDAVAVDRKAEARATVRGVIEAGAPADLWVRVNDWSSGELLADLEAIVAPHLVGVALPKADAVADIQALDRVLADFERRRGMDPGSVSIMPMPETAHGMYHAYDLYAASPRCTVATGVAGSAPGGDYYRALGNTWTREGVEAAYGNARAVLIARAAGLTQILCGPNTFVDDLEHVEEVMRRTKILGATGSMVIHPSHVEVARRVYGPSAEDVDAAVALLVAMQDAVAAGRGAVRHQGGMIDYAMVRTSLDLLAEAEADGLEVPDYPRPEVLAF